ncbi:hypothetical protein NOF04DRAFT_13991 [Fusarium oxysporum II5]|uniref:Uncharacterized protein n=1 Tax=Fusarium odoratissimum (strain NRRL 54006) TaxID=1089451 RepID=X0IW24_FUSO5|nr:uncharacterized protein FOIG_13805 [Fusarium odoratissimum NRRL 54006]EXL93158.1 hypothetical protein FOIG_13805 [Fusarium odoratissimum NRRL 54006]KAK2132212.1 hypothetical protein NOF04DRAFT_13991 [Fusarium oxysporum II5]
MEKEGEKKRRKESSKVAHDKPVTVCVLDYSCIILPERRPDWRPGRQDTVAIQHALVLAAMEAWDNFEERILQSLCKTMPNRVNAVITAEG